MGLFIARIGGQIVPNVETDSESVFEVAEYCGNLSCHKVIIQTTGRGRRREFCSDTCRRAADRDYKRAKALVEVFERNLRKVRYEVAAHGRKAESDGDLRTPDEEARIQMAALSALSRAEAVLEYASSAADDRFLQELRQLVEAVRPAIGAGDQRITA